MRRCTRQVLLLSAFSRGGVDSRSVYRRGQNVGFSKKSAHLRQQSGYQFQFHLVVVGVKSEFFLKFSWFLNVLNCSMVAHPRTLVCLGGYEITDCMEVMMMRGGGCCMCVMLLQDWWCCVHQPAVVLVAEAEWIHQSFALQRARLSQSHSCPLRSHPPFLLLVVVTIFSECLPTAHMLVLWVSYRNQLTTIHRRGRSPPTATGCCGASRGATLHSEISILRVIVSSKKTS
jgi:hypothetical protein